jgi:hypothetical protein
MSKKQQQRLLERAAALQTKFWDLIGELEAELEVDIDGTEDLSGLRIEDLKS